MRNFQNERIVLGAMAVGEAEAALAITLDWVKTRQAFGGHPDGPCAPVFARLRLDAGYAAGNLVVLSRAAVCAIAAVALPEGAPATAARS